MPVSGGHRPCRMRVSVPTNPLPSHTSVRILLLLLLVATVGCIGSKSREAARTSPDQGTGREARAAGPAATDSRPSLRTAPVPAGPEADEKAEIERVIAIARAAYERGLESLENGDADAAQEHFDRAVEAFNDSGVSIDQSPRLRAAFDRMVEEIAALDQDMNEVPGGELPPTEELDEMTPDLSPEEAERRREELGPREVTFDIPMVVNEKVLAWIDIFRNNSVFRKSFIGGYERYGWYEPMIHRILEEEGLPSDLIFMAFLESTYKTSAYSRARAKGIWQFMTPTGRQYGLKINWYVDERSHPEKSTRAAARYMKDLYATFGDWHLAIAAYNTGAGNVSRAQRRSGKTDYWDLTRTPYMRQETKNFVPAILALALMAKNPEKYGFEGLRHNDPLEFDRVTVDGPTDLSLIASLSGSTPDEIKFLNPHLRRGVTPPGEKDHEILVPAGRGPKFTAAYRSLPESERIAQLDQIHIVRRGETLGLIASRYGTSVGQLTAANSIRNPHSIRVGTRLIVPARGGAVAAMYDDDYEAGGVHVVRRGETLSTIASRYGTSLRSLMSANGIRNPHRIRVGMRVSVPSRGRSVASSVQPQGNSRHVVRRGDTLYGISRAYNVSLASLLEWNRLSKDSVLLPGQSLVVGREAAEAPGGQKVAYRVRRGDNLFRIALKYGTTVENLKAWNDIAGDDIRAGEVLTIYSN